MPELRTERLLLRTVRPEDLGAMHAVLGDARAMRYWSTPPHADLATTGAWLAAMAAIVPGEGEDFVVEHDGEVIGKAGFFRFPDVGFILRSDRWGRGLASEALRAVVDRAFAVHRLPAVTADVDPRNGRSLRLLAGLGFVEFGRQARTWLVGDEWCDSVYLRLTEERRQWAAAR